jgi:hypothetical protein
MAMPLPPRFANQAFPSRRRRRSSSVTGSSSGGAAATARNGINHHFQKVTDCGKLAGIEQVEQLVGVLFIHR